MGAVTSIAPLDRCGTCGLSTTICTCISKGTGAKADSGKPDYTLVPFKGLEKVARVLEYGAKKYARGNWAKVPDAKHRYLGAAMRHLAARCDGEMLDPESGLSHVACACCSLLFMLALGEGE